MQMKSFQIITFAYKYCHFRCELFLQNTPQRLGSAGKAVSSQFYNSLICLGFEITIFYIQTVPGTKHHRFILELTFFATPLFFQTQKKRLMRIVHLQDLEFVSFELYFSSSLSQKYNKRKRTLFYQKLSRNAYLL